MVVVKKDCGNVPYKLIFDFNNYLPPTFDFNHHTITLFNSFCSFFVEPNNIPSLCFKILMEVCLR